MNIEILLIHEDYVTTTTTTTIFTLMLSILMSLKRRLESLPATKNHQGLGDSEDESDAKIFSVLTLKLACNHLHISSSN